MINSIRNFSDEHRRLKRLLNSMDRATPVLDVGCGYGRNLLLLRQLGFTNLQGVEINPDLAAEVQANGFKCYSPAELQAKEYQYGLLIFSHIIEHFDYLNLKVFLEDYFRRLSTNGIIIISSPLFHDAFYNDFDHVKPYLPMSINMIFGKQPSQVQFQSLAVLELEDIEFFKDQFRLQFHPALYLQGSHAWPVQLNRILKLLFVFSGGFIGRKIGWIGRYRQLGSRNQ